MVVEAVLPFIAPGLIVQLPAGRPERTTLPVDKSHVGCVIIPATGAGGVTGCAPITIFEEDADVQPAELVTVKLYIPGTSPEMVFEAVLPVIPPGLIVQLPAGSPERSTLPVGVVHVGCTGTPGTGAEGVAGWAAIVAITTDDMQVLSDALLTSML